MVHLAVKHGQHEACLPGDIGEIGAEGTIGTGRLGRSFNCALICLAPCVATKHFASTPPDRWTHWRRFTAIELK